YPLGKRSAGVMRHSDEEATLRSVSDLIDRADVRMVQRGRGFGFRNKSALRLFAAEQMRGKKLQRDKAVEPGIGRLIDDAHAPAAEGLKNEVRPDFPTDHDSVCCV